MFESDNKVFGDVLPGLVFDQNFVLWEVQWLFSYFCLICLLKGLPISVLMFYSPNNKSEVLHIGSIN